METLPQPKDIYTGEQPWESFGDRKTAFTAGVIVRFCKHRNGWHPFSEKEIRSFSNSDLEFSRLMHPKEYIILGDDKQYRVTKAFIKRCKESADRNQQKRHEKCD